MGCVGRTAKTVKARLQQTAYAFEQDCRAGRVKTREEIGQIELSEIKSGNINELLRKYQMSGNSRLTEIKVYTIVCAVMKMAYEDDVIDSGMHIGEYVG